MKNLVVIFTLLSIAGVVSSVCQPHYGSYRRYRVSSKMIVRP